MTSGQTPLSPVYPFNEPSQPIRLYQGGIGGLAVGDVSGAVDLRLVPEVSVDWAVDNPFEHPQFAERNGEIPLTLHRPGGDVALSGYVRGIEGGWSNGATFGSDSSPLDRVIAHWFNVPDWHGPDHLEETSPDGEHRHWLGRWVMEAEGWKITLDMRHDHPAIWTDLHKSDVLVMTHVMEIRRSDGAAFTAQEVDPVLVALHVGISFALGRWVAPLLPVGLGNNGGVLWEKWQPTLCDPGRVPLQRVFGERLSAVLPERVLPVSADPPKDLALLLDDEYTQIKQLLQPGRRVGHEARARIRTLLAMEAHVEPDTRVSEKDVDRVEKGIRNGDPRDMVFPRLSDVSTAVDGEGLTITVHFTKKDGAPVRYVADDSIPAAAIREIDLQNKYRRSPAELASDVGLSGPRAVALRRHLGIDDDESCRHDFQFGSQRHTRYSDNALTKMREAVRTLDMDAIWKAHNPAGKACPPCSVKGCKTV